MIDDVLLSIRAMLYPFTSFLFFLNGFQDLRRRRSTMILFSVVGLYFMVMSVAAVYKMAKDLIAANVVLDYTTPIVILMDIALLIVFIRQRKVV